MTKHFFRILGLVLAGAGVSAVAAAPFEFASDSAVTRGADLRGRVVETRDGEELGRVHDFAVDLDSGRVAYVVVSVGSFLIEDSLIAVAPDALRESADPDGRLVLEAAAASLRDARRFSAGDWPRRADVLASSPSQPPPAEDGAGDDDAPTSVQAAGRGTASISDGNRTATLSAGERSIRFDNPPPPQPEVADAERPEPATYFDRLDRNGDGTLDRAEIAHELTRNDRYADIDSNGNGAVERAEFEALLSRRDGSGE